MRVLDRPLTRLLEQARARGRDVLLEHEGLALARALGVGVPEHRLVRDAGEAARADLDAFPGARLVVKVVSPGILHKSDAGGVRFVEKERAAVTGAVGEMADRFAGDDVAGFLLCEHVEHDRALGGELLLGLRWTDDFGPVVVLGPGGVDAEHLAAHLRPASATAAPASSSRSIALSGSRRSRRKRDASSAALWTAGLVYLTWWCSW